MRQKYFIVTGTYDEFKYFSKKKYQQLWASGNFVQHTDLIYASLDSIRGYRNPTGWFYGTWRDRKDIDELITHLRLYHSNQNVVLEKLHREVRERNK